MKNKKLIILFTSFVFFFVLVCQSSLALVEDGSKIECSRDDGGNHIVIPDRYFTNFATVGQNITLTCMGKTGAFTGDSTVSLSGSTGNTSIVTVAPEIMLITVNIDGSTPDVPFIIMSTAPGSTDVVVDFFGSMNFDVFSTLWTFQEASTSPGGIPPMTTPTPSGGISSIAPEASLPTPSGGSSSTSSGPPQSNDSCRQCKQKSSRKACKTCCSSIARRSSDKKCNCLKVCKSKKLKR